MAQKEYPVAYSLVELTYVDGTKSEFLMKAGAGIAKYLRDELRDHLCLRLRNDTDILVVLREQLRSFALRQITKE